MGVATLGRIVAKIVWTVLSPLRLVKVVDEVGVLRASSSVETVRLGNAFRICSRDTSSGSRAEDVGVGGVAELVLFGCGEFSSHTEDVLFKGLVVPKQFSLDVLRV